MATIVSLQRCSSYEPTVLRAALARLLEPLGGIGAFVKPGRRVLLKPNLIVPRPSEAAVTTHPEIVRAMALIVREAGGRPFVGDSPASGSAAQVARAAGIAAVARELGLEIADLAKRPRTCAGGPGSPHKWIRCGAEALEADVVINLPKLKTHGQMGMSLAVKNLFGVVAGKRKALFHFWSGNDAVRFGRLLVAIARLVKPALSILDGVVALEGGGPTSGDPRPLGMLAASADPVALDRVVLELLGIAPERIPHMQAAQELGYGEQDLGKIEIVGESLDSMRVKDYVAIGELRPISFTLPHVLRSVVKQVMMLLGARKKAK